MIIAHNELSMERVNILIDKIPDIKEFSIKVSKYTNLNLVSGGYCIPVNYFTSILDVAEFVEIEMKYPTDIHNEIIKNFGKWIVEE